MPAQTGFSSKVKSLSFFFPTFEASFLSKGNHVVNSWFWNRDDSGGRERRSYTSTKYRLTEIFPLTHEYLYMGELARMPHA